MASRAGMTVKRRRPAESRARVSNRDLRTGKLVCGTSEGFEGPDPLELIRNMIGRGEEGETGSASQL